VRFCPSLAKKPKTNQTEQNGSQPFDPFSNPSGSLFISRIPILNPTHVLVLNKFPVIDHHFIVATIPFRLQTEDLELDDLEVSYSLIKAWNGNRGLFAFFNSGKHSGASQMHRHIQFLPVEDIVGKGNEQGWQLLCESLKGDQQDHDVNSRSPKVPFEYFKSDISDTISSQKLYDTYQRLLRRTRLAWTEYHRLLPSTETDQFSYNLAMTESTLMLCPRTKGCASLTQEHNPDVESVQLNGTMLAGTLLVKHQKQWDYLCSKEGILDSVLKTVGVPSQSRTASSI